MQKWQMLHIPTWVACLVWLVIVHLWEKHRFRHWSHQETDHPRQGLNWKYLLGSRTRLPASLKDEDKHIDARPSPSLTNFGTCAKYDFKKWCQMVGRDLMANIRTVVPHVTASVGLKRDLRSAEIPKNIQDDVKNYGIYWLADFFLFKNSRPPSVWF